ncbi:MAG: tRNA 2-thiouridylase [Parcubacteria group bacterium Gr01-1014_44]|nr:MAG: tRNA 2-thiouridylase [Parcubacteria group bacterium Gr01-1014_44]
MHYLQVRREMLQFQGKMRQNIAKSKSKVFVAMSGGVDSSVAAALLKKQGYEVTGVFFKPWAPFAEASSFGKPSEDKSGGHNSPVFYCDWQQDRRDAMAVAEVLGIPFKTWDFSKEYKNKVGDYMIKSYRQGSTPNPDVMCNKEIKFGLFLKKALKEGADFIAAGHYVRREPEFPVIENSLKTKNCKLKIAKDKNKDQSYFLWTLTQEQLKHCLFPIGNYLKPEVRKLAKKFGLPNFDKKDSQGVCFIGQLNMKEFLKNYIPSKLGKVILQEAPGNKVFFDGAKKTVPTAPLANLHSTDKVIGAHDGAAYYTIGQRHGLNIGIGNGPYYVSGKDLKKNLVFVTKNEKTIGKKEIIIKNINWINRTGPKNISVKARYRAPAVPARLAEAGSGGARAKIVVNGSMIKIRTAKPIRAVTPGQSVVFYRNQEMLGGGIIE